jgi:hypothetical protein
MLGGGVSYAFPAGKTLAPGAFYVIASSAAFFAQRYQRSPDGDFARVLDNKGESIILQDAKGNVITKVAFETAPPWPASADGAGYSLVPVESNPTGDAADPAKWKASKCIGGTPYSDDATGSCSPIAIQRQIARKDGATLLEAIKIGQYYQFSFAAIGNHHARLQLFDLCGRQILTLFDGPVCGSHTISVPEARLGQGIAFCRLSSSAGIIADAVCVAR